MEGKYQLKEIDRMRGCHDIELKPLLKGFVKRVEVRQNYFCILAQDADISMNIRVSKDMASLDPGYFLEYGLPPDEIEEIWEKESAYRNHIIAMSYGSQEPEP